MARRKQEGNRFFRLDVDFFSDKKVKILKARYGADGVTLYLYILCEIYKAGYYLKIQDALENPVKVFPVRTDSSGVKSQKYMGRHGTVSINPDKGSLIQCNPTDTDYVRRIGNGNAKI